MYKQFFQLRANPFNVNPDPNFLYLTRQAREALAALTYGIQSRKGFLLLTGDVGTGKTTLVNKVLEWLRKHQIATAFVFNSSLNVPEFLDYMMADFGFDCAGLEKSRILLKLNAWLLEKYRQGKAVVLIVDEAQNLSQNVLEEIRLLTNLETASSKLLQIVLSGQPELEQKLRQPELRQLSQRITLRCKTQPLTQAETAEYIGSRLKTAGSLTGDIFSSEASVAVYRFSHGIPRLINLICEHALISAYVDQKKIIDVLTVENVAQEFEFDFLAPAKWTTKEQRPRQDEVSEILKQLEALNERLNRLDVADAAASTKGGIQ